VVNSRRALAIGGLLLALATLCGALGTHGLHLTPEQLRIWDTATRYHFLQSLGLLIIGLQMRMRDLATLRSAAALLLVGVIVFCGSLYALALGAPRGIGWLTPVGGVASIAGWLAFAAAVWRHPKE
jgi:uncharacterized membrane protein YgdD (TMEM256/DUF423 family)